MNSKQKFPNFLIVISSSIRIKDTQPKYCGVPNESQHTPPTYSPPHPEPIRKSSEDKNRRKKREREREQERNERN